MPRRACSEYIARMLQQHASVPITSLHSPALQEPVSRSPHTTALLHPRTQAAAYDVALIIAGEQLPYPPVYSSAAPPPAGVRLVALRPAPDVPPTGFEGADGGRSPNADQRIRVACRASGVYVGLLDTLAQPTPHTAPILDPMLSSQTWCPRLLDGSQSFRTGHC